jgi:hypothetical protein
MQIMRQLFNFLAFPIGRGRPTRAQTIVSEESPLTLGVTAAGAVRPPRGAGRVANHAVLTKSVKT